MQLERVLRRVMLHVKPETLAGVGSEILRYRPARRIALQCVNGYLDHRVEQAWNNHHTLPPRVIEDRAHVVRALAHSMDRALSEGHVSKAVIKGMLRSLIMNALLRQEHWTALERYRQEHDGYDPPSFAVISPGKLCNLHCKGCYASSGCEDEKLNWDVFDRIITELKALWGVGFVTISGGEPLAYSSQGMGILDAAAKHQDIFFVMFTNGTLIDRRIAARMAEVGNLTPAISVEGWEEATDARRGKGVFRRVLAAMANLREAGVPFGISLTATRENCEQILSDEFLTFFFEEQGALYGWLFQYMPIGRGITLDQLPTPEQRAWMWRRSWEIVRDKHYFLPDFWNMGTVSSGCISAGRQGGYLYFDWNGKVMPCVFVPYSPVNINDAYREGKTLNDILREPFFEAIREWQRQYGYAADRPAACKNWTMPCIIRDHHRDFRRILERTEPDPEDDAALQALLDPTYRDGLILYDEALAQVMDRIWEEEYQGVGQS